MGKEFYNLTPEQLCDLMCGGVEYDGEEQPKKRNKTDRRRKEDIACGTGLFNGSQTEHRTDGK